MISMSLTKSMTLVRMSKGVRQGHPLILLTVILGACSSYSEKISHGRESMRRGQADEAVALLSEQLDENDQGEKTLLTLERGIALQHAGRFQASTVDFQTADQELEVLDYTSMPVDEAAKYLYSDDSAPYRPPLFEKGGLNLFNAINYIVLKDWSGAKVELRRFEVLLDYWKDKEVSRRQLDRLTDLKRWLGAFVYTALRSRTEAEKEAARMGVTLPDVPDRPDGERYSPVLIIAHEGQVPHKKPVRFPIGQALLYLGPGHGLSPAQRKQLAVIQAKGLVKWVNFPVLSKTREVVSALTVDQRPTQPTLKVHFASMAQSAYEEAKGSMMLAAISRLITRAVVGEVSQRAVAKGTNGLIGLLVGLISEGAMVAADTPDTRSWSMLPAQLKLYWLWLPPGRHDLAYRAERGGWSTSLKITGDGHPIVYCLSPSGSYGGSSIN